MTCPGGVDTTFDRGKDKVNAIRLGAGAQVLCYDLSGQLVDVGDDLGTLRGDSRGRLFAVESSGGDVVEMTEVVHP